jgi:4-amino-4-deoxy-L-arabinose transferase-like glycosyltransferase
MLDDRIMAVHVASAACSTLLVLATYLLGVAAFSRAAGLLAALALAVDRNALWWSVEGFRDDAFALFVVLSALALVHLWRRPTAMSGALFGLAGAAACLTRITSLSFLFPALVVLLLARGERAPQRRRAAGVAALVLMALVGPFLLSCWVAFGDPLYAVNFHTKFYRSRSGLPFQESMGWLDYLRAGSPLREQAETGLRGLTTYPFKNKWQGLDGVAAWVPLLMSASAVAGLALFLRSAPGRLLLLVLFTSLLPFAFTWAIPGGAEWRFTMHAYPFYLVAAGLALTTAVTWTWRKVRARDGSAAA